MFDYYKEYRNRNMVIPWVDIITYPKGYVEENIPTPVFSKWALNLKSSGNLDKGAIAGSAAGALGHAFLGMMALGGGAGGGMASLAGIGNSIGKIGGTIGKSSMSVLGMAADDFARFEKSYWNYYYILMTFDPASGHLGEEHIGKRNDQGCLGHWFYENGDYFEGFLYNNGVRYGIFVFADGSRFYGTILNFTDNLKQDLGIMIGPDGSRLEGKFENGQLEVGVYETETCAFVGSWSNGVLNGMGAARYSDNSVFYGQWSNGNPIR